MKVIGLTGGIGSGKTTVANHFRDLGVPVYIADDHARDLTNTDPRIREAITATFGDHFYRDGTLDRKQLASEVFKDEAKLEKLNEIIHPVVESHFEAWKAKQSAPYVVYEAAILFEKGGYKKCDFTILVTADQEERIRRIILRDQSTREQILDRMGNQWDDNKKRPLADFEIININPKEVALQVREFHRKFSE